MVVADEEVEHGITRAACHSFYDLVWNWGHTGVANGDGVEGLEVVDKAQGAVLFLTQNQRERYDASECS